MPPNLATCNGLYVQKIKYFLLHELKILTKANLVVSVAVLTLMAAVAAVAAVVAVAAVAANLGDRILLQPD